MSLSTTTAEEATEEREALATDNEGFPVDACFEQGLNRLLPNHPAEHQNVMPSLEHDTVGGRVWIDVWWGSGRRGFKNLIFKIFHCTSPPEPTLQSAFRAATARLASPSAH